MRKLIPANLLERGLAIAASNSGDTVISRIFLDFDVWLEDAEFDRDHDTEFFGVFFPNSEFDEIDEDKIQEYFESTLDEPESRLLRYRLGEKLTDEEITGYKDTLISNAYAGNYPGIYYGEISDGSRSIFYFGTRMGSSWEGIRYEDLGIFLSMEQAKKILFSDGILA
mgnify:CR=1 FL=1